MENLYSAIDEIVLSIKESKEYKMCLSLKEKMDNKFYYHPETFKVLSDERPRRDSNP